MLWAGHEKVVIAKTKYREPLLSWDICFTQNFGHNANNQTLLKT
jgi:hypothetical protein